MVAVVILNWNGSKLLREYLPSVVKNTPAEQARVVVADNGSDDDSLAMLASDFPEVETIVLDKNYGFAGGYNRAIEQVADCEYVVLLNSDVRTPEGWLRPLLDYMTSHPETAAVQPKLLKDRDDDQQHFEYAGASGGFLDRHGFPYCRGRVFMTVEQDQRQYEEPMSVFWATGACLMVRTAAYRAVGGLDEEFFAHMEEIDLCWRLRLAGHDIACVPQSSVYHLGGGSLAYGNARKTYLNFRNNLLLLYKNLPAARAKTLLLRRRLIDTIAFFKFALTFHLGDARAVIRAHRDFRTMRHRYDSQQPDVNLLGDFPGTDLNIIVQYYLLQRRRFSRLPIHFGGKN